MWVRIVVVAALASAGLLAVQPAARTSFTLTDLPLLAIIEGDAQFSPSSAVATDGCGILLVGAEWGSLVKIDSSGAAYSVGRIGDGLPLVNLEHGMDGRVLAWSHYPDYFALINPTSWHVDELPLAPHPWGQALVGPMQQVGADEYAIATLANTSSPIARPERWPATPELIVVNGQGEVRRSFGEVAEASGRFVAWLHGQQAVGVVDETLVTLALTTGRVTGYRLHPPSSSAMEFSFTLPQYFRRPGTWEEVRVLPWIDINGEIPLIQHVRHVEAAAIDASGYVYALRNYSVVWRRVDSRYFRRRGRWESAELGLEIYNLNGELMGRYRAPAGADRIRVDLYGRILIGEGIRRVVVLRNPVEPVATRCERPTGTMTIPYADNEPD
jgi:hypothetical protein